MRHSIFVIPVAAGLSFVAADVSADRPTISTYGTPGIVELPSAKALNDGELSFSSSVMLSASRNAVSFQVFPRVMGTFRYSIIRDFVSRESTLEELFKGQRFDRSFDLQIQLMDQERVGVDLAVGLRDFIGTGVYSSEYVVATRDITDQIEASVGIGWGRLGGRTNFKNPLAILSKELETRNVRDAGLGGEIEAGQWFRGDASFFGGIDWQLTDRTNIQLEYSPDLYDRELLLSEIDNTTPFNAAVQYRFENDATLRGYVVGGENIGAQFNFFLDPKGRVIPGGRDSGPAPVFTRDTQAAKSWAGNPTEGLRRHLTVEGIELERLELGAARATAYVQNLRWDVEAQAAGRAARAMAQTLPASVQTFTVVFQNEGMPLSSVTTKRSDLENFQYDYDGAWRTLARAGIDGAGIQGAASPRFTYALSPYLAASFFDPQSPIRADFGPQLDIGYRAAPGLSFSGRIRYPVAGNLGDSVRESDSEIQRVRSESYLYAREADFEINKLAGEYLWRPDDDTFARVSVGILENHFGGVSSEILWRPVDSRTALGLEVNYAKQRDFDMLFGFQDYDVITGHASVYHDLGNGYNLQVDAGRYLAGDWGATFSFDREFNNGVRAGAFFTLTDVPFDEFGEGSFDKGIEFEFPLSYFSGNANRLKVGQTLRPVLRDGGARLQVDNRLHDITREYTGPELADGWGLYLR